MKILVLNYEFPPLGGGAAPVSRDLAIALAREGHDVAVVTMWYRGLPDYEQYEGGVKIYRIKCIRKTKSACAPWEQLSYLISLRLFMRSHKELQQFDVCHAHFVIPTGEGAKWIYRKYGIPYIITAHGSDVEGHNTKKSMQIMHKVLRTGWRKIVDDSSIVISPSKYLLDRMYSNYSCGNYEFIPNGIDYDIYRELSEGPKTKTILVMGRLQKFKGVQVVLDAASKIDLNGWKILILGDGPYRNELEKLVDTLRLKEKVFFCGWIDNKSEKQLNYIKESSIYVSASQFENCPMSVVETIVAGCYPILSDIPAHRQLVADDEYYFNACDSIQLANKLDLAIKEIEDKGVFISLPNLSRYAWKNVAKEYEKILKDNKR